jgi:hypothetical protein
MSTSFEGFKLYAKPTFWEGVARLIDFSGSLNEYNYSESTDQADFRAIQSDWESVGLDILEAIKKFEKENHGRINQ